MVRSKLFWILIPASIFSAQLLCEQYYIMFICMWNIQRKSGKYIQMLICLQFPKSHLSYLLIFNEKWTQCIFNGISKFDMQPNKALNFIKSHSVLNWCSWGNWDFLLFSVFCLVSFGSFGIIVFSCLALIGLIIVGDFLLGVAFIDVKIILQTLFTCRFALLSLFTLFVLVGLD